ncbi:MAG: caspase family protein [Polyangiaceae bacterium]
MGTGRAARGVLVAGWLVGACVTGPPTVTTPALTIVPQLGHFLPDGELHEVCAAFSADGKSLFTFGTEGALKRWDASTGLLLSTEVVPAGSSCAASRGGAVWVEGDWAGALWIRDSNGERRASLGTIAMAVAVSGDGKYAAAATPLGRVVRVDTATGDVVGDWTFPDACAQARLSPTGRYLALWRCSEVKAPQSPGLDVPVEPTEPEPPLPDSAEPPTPPIEPKLDWEPRIVDAQTGELVWRASGACGPVAFAGEGASGYALVACADGLRRVSLDHGSAEQAPIPWPADWPIATRMEVTPEGRIVFARGSFDPATLTWAPHAGHCDVLTATDERIACLGDSQVQIAALSDAAPLAFLAPFRRDATVSVVFAPGQQDARLVSTTAHGVARVFELDTLSAGPSYWGEALGNIGAVGALSPNGRWLAIGDRVYDTTRVRAAKDASAPEGSVRLEGARGVTALTWTRDGQSLVVSTLDSGVSAPFDDLPKNTGLLRYDLSNLEAAQQVEPVTLSKESAFGLGVVAGANELVSMHVHVDTDHLSGVLRRLDLQSGAVLAELPTQGVGFTITTHPSDKAFLFVEVPMSMGAGLSLDKPTALDVRSATTLEVTRTLWKSDHLIIATAFDATGSRVAASTMAGEVVVLDYASGRELGRYSLGASLITGVAFSANGKLLAAASREGAIRLIRLDRPDTGITLVTSPTTQRSGDLEWLVVGDDGVFDASLSGASLGAALIGGHALPVDRQGWEKNRPDVLLERMGLGTEETRSALRALAERRARRLGRAATTPDSAPPTVELVTAEPRGKMLELAFSAASDKGLASYQIYVQGVPVFAGGGRPLGGTRAEVRESIELSQGWNRIEVSVTDATQHESLRAQRLYPYEGEVDRDLYFIGFGVSAYRDPELRLEYAAKDARDLGDLFARSRGFRHVHTLEFTDEQVSEAALADVRRTLSSTHADDVVVLFVSGHGTQIGDAEPRYVFLPATARVDDLEHSTFELGLFEDVLDGVPARNRLLLIDTCESGERDEGDELRDEAAAGAHGLRARSSRGVRRQRLAGKSRSSTVVGDPQRLVAGDLRKRSGAIIISSSRGAELSYEQRELENGVFTQALLEVLTQPRKTDRALSIDELRNGVSDLVRERTADLQHPSIDRDNLDLRFLPLLPEIDDSEIASRPADPIKVETKP